MFGIGLPEMIVIFAVALIVVGPDKLPGLARSLAKGLAEMKRTMHQVKDSLTQEGDVIDSVQKELKTTAEELRAKMTDVDPEVWQLPEGKDRETEKSENMLDLEPVSTYPEVAAHPLGTAAEADIEAISDAVEHARAENEQATSPAALATDTDTPAPPAPSTPV